VAERTGYWSGPNPWAETVDDADPTGGRHAFDRDAALTPIFTTLRRRVRRPYLQPVPHDRWPAPDAADHLRRDPQTAPIPVVRPLYAVDPERGYPGGPHAGFTAGRADGYASSAPVAPPAPFPTSSAPSPTETTTWWRSPVGFPPVPPRGEPPVRHRPAYDDPGLPASPPRPAPVPDPADHDLDPYDGVQYEGVRYDGVRYDGVRYDGVRYDAAGYDVGPYDVGPYDAVLYDALPGEAAPYDPVPEVYDTAWHDGPHADAVRYDGPPHGGVPRVRPPYDPTPYDPTPYDRAAHDRAANDRARYGRDRLDGRGHDPNRYDPLTDTGRHHRRLAPAGW
jgi:hypothetical protein